MEFTKAQLQDASAQVWWWVQEGRKMFLADEPKPKGGDGYANEMSIRVLAQQMGWNQEKVMHDAMVNVFVVKEAMANIQQNRSLWRKICDAGTAVRYRAYAVWYRLRNAGHGDETADE